MISPAAILDPTKMPAGAMTMVYKDYYFLQRWVDYYSRQFGREHLYILSHGGDPTSTRLTWPPPTTSRWACASSASRR